MQRVQRVQRVQRSRRAARALVLGLGQSAALGMRLHLPRDGDADRARRVGDEHRDPVVVFGRHHERKDGQAHLGREM